MQKRQPYAAYILDVCASVRVRMRCFALARVLSFSFSRHYHNIYMYIHNIRRCEAIQKASSHPFKKSICGECVYCFAFDVRCVLFEYKWVRISDCNKHFPNSNQSQKKPSLSLFECVRAFVCWSIASFPFAIRFHSALRWHCNKQCDPVKAQNNWHWNCQHFENAKNLILSRMLKRKNEIMLSHHLFVLDGMHVPWWKYIVERIRFNDIFFVEGGDVDGERGTKKAILRSPQFYRLFVSISISLAHIHRQLDLVPLFCFLRYFTCNKMK